jgi:hypothetical protein
MFQVGRIERFSYKDAVKKQHPKAFCKGKSLNAYNGGNTLIGRLYAVYVSDKRVSEAYRSAEDAWQTPIPN